MSINTDPIAERARITHLRSLLAKATKRPWVKFHSIYGSDVIAIMKGEQPRVGKRREIIAWPGFDSADTPKRYQHADAELLCEVVNTLPWLLDLAEKALTTESRPEGLELREYTADEIRAAAQASIDAPGCTMRQFARETGISSAKLCEFLSGKRGPEPSIVEPMGYRWALISSWEHPYPEDAEVALATRFPQTDVPASGEVERGDGSLISGECACSGNDPWCDFCRLPEKRKIATSRDIMIAGGVDPDAPFSPGPFPSELRQAEPTLPTPSEGARDSALEEADRMAIISATVEEAEQACRYVAKHSSSNMDFGDYREGFEIACEVCERAIADHVKHHNSRIPALGTAKPEQAGAGFVIGERVEKISGSSWRGRIVGTYSTTLTPEGYAVESDTEHGSVQIYPCKALRLVAAAPQGQNSGKD